MSDECSSGSRRSTPSTNKRTSRCATKHRYPSRRQHTNQVTSSPSHSDVTPSHSDVIQIVRNTIISPSPMQLRHRHQTSPSSDHNSCDDAVSMETKRSHSSDSQATLQLQQIDSSSDDSMELLIDESADDGKKPIAATQIQFGPTSTSDPRHNVTDQATANDVISGLHQQPTLATSEIPPVPAVSSPDTKTPAPVVNKTQPAISTMMAASAITGQPRSSTYTQSVKATPSSVKSQCTYTPHDMYAMDVKKRRLDHGKPAPGFGPPSLRAPPSLRHFFENGGRDYSEFLRMYRPTAPSREATTSSSSGRRSHLMPVYRSKFQAIAPRPLPTALPKQLSTTQGHYRQQNQDGYRPVLPSAYREKRPPPEYDQCVRTSSASTITTGSDYRRPSVNVPSRYVSMASTPATLAANGISTGSSIQRISLPEKPSDHLSRLTVDGYAMTSRLDNDVTMTSPTGETDYHLHDNSNLLFPVTKKQQWTLYQPSTGSRSSAEQVHRVDSHAAGYWDAGGHHMSRGTESAVPRSRLPAHTRPVISHPIAPEVFRAADSIVPLTGCTGSDDARERSKSMIVKVKAPPHEEMYERLSSDGAPDNCLVIRRYHSESQPVSECSQIESIARSASGLPAAGATFHLPTMLNNMTAEETSSPYDKCAPADYRNTPVVTMATDDDVIMDLSKKIKPEVMDENGQSLVEPCDCRLKMPGTTSKCGVDAGCYDDDGNDVSSWSVDEVAQFVSNVPGCSEYAEAFVREKIDGTSLSHVTDDHLLNVFKMRLGHVIKLRLAVDSLQLSQQPQSQHCSNAMRCKQSWNAGKEGSSF